MKHAFSYLESGGKLEIRVESFINGVQLIVCDNSTWNGQSATSNGTTGMGIEMMEAYYRIFEKQHKCKNRSFFMMLKENKPLMKGTEVKIRIEY